MTKLTKKQLNDISKEISYLLRHGAEKEKLAITSDGWVHVEDMLEFLNRKKTVTKDDIEVIVRTSDKQRFSLNGDLIRANQGHTLSVSVEMENMTTETIPETVIHGTYSKYIDSILENGLNRMNRQHIHLTTGIVGDKNVTSGMRNDVDIFIYVDAKKAIEDGIPFYRSSNGVILTPGINGILPTKYIKYYTKK